jgi:hypothetical protein
MRVIKFRAWDSANAKMIQVKELRQTTERYLNNGELKYFDYPLMQYTGLKDKNGKEIYEGDILKRGDLGGEVYWQEAMSRYVIDSCSGNRQPDKALALELFPAKLFEVIGNIYENPDLLKEKKDD